MSCRSRVKNRGGERITKVVNYHLCRFLPLMKDSIERNEISIKQYTGVNNQSKIRPLTAIISPSHKMTAWKAQVRRSLDRSEWCLRQSRVDFRRVRYQSDLTAAHTLRLRTAWGSTAGQLEVASCNFRRLHTFNYSRILSNAMIVTE